MSRAYTRDEMRTLFLAAIAAEVEKPAPEGLEGRKDLAARILSVLDGEKPSVPELALVGKPFPDERLHCEDEGLNYWPEEIEDFGGELAEDFRRGW